MKREQTETGSECRGRREWEFAFGRRRQGWMARKLFFTPPGRRAFGAGPGLGPLASRDSRVATRRDTQKVSSEGKSNSAAQSGFPLAPEVCAVILCTKCACQPGVGKAWASEGKTREVGAGTGVRAERRRRRQAGRQDRQDRHGSKQGPKAGEVRSFNQTACAKALVRGAQRSAAQRKRKRKRSEDVGL